MQLQQQYIVPALGGVILLSVFMLGAPLIYLILIGILGLAAAGTYYMPHAVQVEVRIGIAALGLILLIFISSLGFWLALMSFGAIGALQIRHRNTLQNPPQTIAWLNAVLARRGAAAGGGADGTPALPGALQGKVSIAGIGAVVLGIIVLLTATMTWYSADFAGDGQSFSGWGVAEGIAEDDETALPYVFVVVLAVLALASMASIVLPRVVPILVGIAGLVVTILAMVYISEVTNPEGMASDFGVSLSFGIGAYLAALAFLAVAVLHVIPATFKPLGQTAPDAQPDAPC